VSARLVPIVVPSVGESVPVVRITAWLARVGDAVTEGDALFTITTDKIDVDVPAPATGVVAEVSAPAGAMVPPLAVVGAIAADGRP
jgi:2-oxoglutarate dehydrogenase E2 component (dihydrolipoamide succinyltransferase)